MKILKILAFSLLLVNVKPDFGYTQDEQSGFGITKTTKLCASGTNIGLPCSVDGDCPSSTCTTTTTFSGRSREFQFGPGFDITQSGRKSIIENNANNSLCQELGVGLGVTSGHLFNDTDCDGIQDTGEELLDLTTDEGANAYYVTPDGIATTGCAYSNPCGSIQDAIDQANSDYTSQCDTYLSNNSGTSWNCTFVGTKFVYIAPGVYTENLIAKQGVALVGAKAYNTGTTLHVSGTETCGIDLTDVRDFIIYNMHISNWSTNGYNICSFGGAQNVGIIDVDLTNVTAYGAVGWALHFAGIGNTTIRWQEIETYHIGNEAGAQFYWEEGRPSTALNSNIGRCKDGNKNLNYGGCDADADCQAGNAWEKGTCEKTSADHVSTWNFLQYEGAVGYLIRNPRYCSSTAGSAQTYLGRGCTTNSDCGTSGVCSDGYSKDFNSMGMYNSYQGQDGNGGLCDSDDTNKLKPCYSRCEDGTNKGAKCHTTADCNKTGGTSGTCAVSGTLKGKCSAPGADTGYVCSTNGDCGSNRCEPQPCSSDANCMIGTCTSGSTIGRPCIISANCGGGGTCTASGQTCYSTGYSSTTSCGQNHTWDCATAGDDQCLAGGLWVYNSDSAGGLDLGYDSRAETFGSSNYATAPTSDFDIKASGFNVELRVCQTSARTGLVFESGTAGIDEICYTPTSGIVTNGSAPATPADGELYYNNSLSKWCYYEATGSVTRCIIDDGNPLSVLGGGTGLNAVGAYDIPVCNNGGACGSTNALTSLDVGTYNFVGRGASGAIISTTVNDNYIAAGDKTGSGKIVLQAAPVLGTVSNPATTTVTPSGNNDITNKSYVDSKNYDTKCVNFTSTSGNPIATWLNETGNTITITKFSCYTDTSTEAVRIKECTSTTPRCIGASGTYMQTSTDCDSDSTTVDGTDMTIETGNYVSVQITTDSSSTVVGVCFTYYVN